MQILDTIIFDLSEVLLHGLLGSKRQISNYLEIPYETCDLDTPELKKLFLGSITEKEYLQSLVRESKTGREKDLNTLKKIVRQGFSEINGTREVITTLRKQNYKLGLLSVHAREWIEFCEKNFQYHHLFNELVYSFETGVCKPAQESYFFILNKLNSTPSESVFIDDSTNNTNAASLIGMQTILFKSAQQLSDELKVLNIY